MPLQMKKCHCSSHRSRYRRRICTWPQPHRKQTTPWSRAGCSQTPDLVLECMGRGSGRRIPANTPVELATGDTLRLGGSKREYRLHWLSLREAFEIEDPMPPLLEEDKEEFRTYQEASKQLVPGQRESVDTETHQETSQQILSEQIDFWAKVIPSAPPLPEFAHFFSLEESSLSQFDENREGVIEEKLVDDNPITESVLSSITKAIPATMTNAGRQVQSDKRDASSAVFRRAKLKSVKSLRVDTGGSKERSRTLSYNYQKEEALNENLVCSENCGRECAACMVLVRCVYARTRTRTAPYRQGKAKQSCTFKPAGHIFRTVRVGRSTRTSDY